MFFTLECIKSRRTGMLPAFLGGGLLASAIPLANTALRPGQLAGQPAAAALFSANWSSISLLNLFLVLAGACTLYHTETAGGAIGRLRALPSREEGLFFGKLALLSLLCLLALSLEAAAFVFCGVHWLSGAGLPALLSSFLFALWLLLPSAAGFLLTAWACKSLWASLGVGVICIFTVSMLPPDPLLLAIFPFALPFQSLPLLSEKASLQLAAAAAAQLLLLAAAQLAAIRIRRWFA